MKRQGLFVYLSQFSNFIRIILRRPNSGGQNGKVGDGRLSRHSSISSSSEDIDPGLISVDDDEFRNLAGCSSGLVSGQGSLENLGGSELLRPNSIKLSGSSATSILAVSLTNEAEADLPAIVPQVHQRKSIFSRNLATVEQITIVEVYSQPAGVSAPPRMSSSSPSRSFPVDLVTRPVAKPIRPFPSSLIPLSSDVKIHPESPPENEISQNSPLNPFDSDSDDKECSYSEDDDRVKVNSTFDPGSKVTEVNGRSLEVNVIDHRLTSNTYICEASNATADNYVLETTRLIVEGLLRDVPMQTSGRDQEAQINSSPEMRRNRLFSTSFCETDPEPQSAGITEPLDDSEPFGSRGFLGSNQLSSTVASNTDHAKTIVSAVDVTGDYIRPHDESSNLPKSRTSNFKEGLNVDACVECRPLVEKRDKEIYDLKKYIDNLLVKVIDKFPNLLELPQANVSTLKGVSTPSKRNEKHRMKMPASFHQRVNNTPRDHHRTPRDSSTSENRLELLQEKSYEALITLIEKMYSEIAAIKSYVDTLANSSQQK